MSPYKTIRTGQRLKYSITESQIERSLRGNRSNTHLMLKSLCNPSVVTTSCRDLGTQNSPLHLSGKHFFLHQNLSRSFSWLPPLPRLCKTQNWRQIFEILTKYCHGCSPNTTCISARQATWRRAADNIRPWHVWRGKMRVQGQNRPL